MYKNAEVDILNCCKDASWEADSIVVANQGESVEEVALKMQEVTNCKTVLHFISHENDINKLQQLLPHAKVVSIILSQPGGAGIGSSAFIHGTDTEATDTAKTMILAMGCKHQTPQGA